MTVTDLQVIDILNSGNLLTAGQLADLTGLTTGAITGMLNRLEAAGLVRRERDPNDGRRIIVRLVPDKEAMREVRSVFDATGKSWEEMAAGYDDAQLALLLEFLRRSNAVSQQEIARLRAAPSDEEGSFTAPLGELSGGRLVASGVGKLLVRPDAAMDTLYQARFEGPTPEVKAKDGVVTIRYPRRLMWLPAVVKRSADVTLNGAIPWQIAIQGGGSEIAAELGGLDLAGVEIKGGYSMIHLSLPAPASMVPIRISGAASDIQIHRPAGVAARVHLKGWAMAFTFDDQQFSNMGNDVRMQSPDFKEAAHGYDIEVAASVSAVVITAE
jgi:DNA-binding MarR family transcriptional regulator